MHVDSPATRRKGLQANRLICVRCSRGSRNIATGASLDFAIVVMFFLGIAAMQRMRSGPQKLKGIKTTTKNQDAATEAWTLRPRLRIYKRWGL